MILLLGSVENDSNIKCMLLKSCFQMLKNSIEMKVVLILDPNFRGQYL